VAILSLFLAFTLDAYKIQLESPLIDLSNFQSGEPFKYLSSAFLTL
jgi:hypothetical protein